jgi:chemotaxis protein CheY-P-specific phosphatase CheC
MVNLTELELSTAKEVINIGLSKAADSLSFFMREKILIRSIDFEIKELSSITNVPSTRSEKCYVLVTEVIGELQGICYLIFSEEEAERIFKISLPESILNDSQKMEAMAPAILLEIDNIVSAAVITQFSNLLKYKMYGGVPDLKIMAPGEFKSFMLSKSGDTDLLLSFKAEFIASGQNFNPEFIWILNPIFFDGVKSFLNNSDNIEKLKELSSQTTA